MKKLVSFPCRGYFHIFHIFFMRIYFWYSLPDLKHDQKRSISIPLLNVLEVRPLGTFWSFFSNSCHGNDDRQKNFDFSFGYVFPSSINVQSFITIKFQAKKLSMIKISTFFVSDHQASKTGIFARRARVDQAVGLYYRKET